jgi:hypothetical protein
VAANMTMPQNIFLHFCEDGPITEMRAKIVPFSPVFIAIFPQNGTAVTL